MKPKVLLPEGWEENYLDKVTQRGSGHTPNQKYPEYWNGGIKWVSLADSSRLDRRSIDHTEKEISEEGLKNSSAVLHPQGTVLLSRDAGVGKSSIMGCDMAVSQHFITWNCSAKHTLDNYFLYYWLQGKKGYFERQAVGSTIKTIGLPLFKKLKISYPALPEQKAIADLLSTWDEAIEKTERLIVKKQKFYEAQLSKRLSLDVSERIKLRKFLKEVSKRNRDLSITQVLSVTNSKGFVRPEDQFDRQVASDNLSNYKIVSKGEYAYNPSRINVGSIARLDGWDVGVLSPMYTVFEIKKPSELHTDLFLHWLNSHEAKQRIKLSAQGSVRETVSFDDFCAIGFPKIDFNEQKSLAEYFSLISAEIDTLKALSDKYKTQKRGLMQKMLTGEWRVKSEIVNQYMEA